jgi:hypothetical protein
VLPGASCVRSANRRRPPDETPDWGSFPACRGRYAVSS